MLLPFNIGFYRRMGYGFGGKLYEYHLPTGALPRLDGEGRAHLRLLQPEEFDQAMDCQRRFAARNHGMVEKFDEELRGARGDIQVRRMGYYDGGCLLGYAAYRFESAMRATIPKTGSAWRNWCMRTVQCCGRCWAACGCRRIWPRQ